MMNIKEIKKYEDIQHTNCEEHDLRHYIANNMYDKILERFSYHIQKYSNGNNDIKQDIICELLTNWIKKTHDSNGKEIASYIYYISNKIKYHSINFHIENDSCIIPRNQREKVRYLLEKEDRSDDDNKAIDKYKSLYYKFPFNDDELDNSALSYCVEDDIVDILDLRNKLKELSNYENSLIKYFFIDDNNIKDTMKEFKISHSTLYYKIKNILKKLRTK